MVALDHEPEPSGRLLLEALEEVDRLPQGARDVAEVVVGVCTLERRKRAVGPPPTPEEIRRQLGWELMMPRAKMPGGRS